MSVCLLGRGEVIMKNGEGMRGWLAVVCLYVACGNKRLNSYKTKGLLRTSKDQSSFALRG